MKLFSEVLKVEQAQVPVELDSVMLEVMRLRPYWWLKRLRKKVSALSSTSN